MTEYFISCYSTKKKEKVLQYCCSIGDLSIKEVALFKQESGIKDNPDFDLHKEPSMPANDVAEILEHREALKEFALAIHERLCQWSHRTHSSPVIEKMIEYQGVASDIRAERGHGSDSTSPVVSLSADATNSKLTHEPKVGLETEDLADKVARLIEKGKGCWKKPNIFADTMVDADKDRFPTRKTAVKVLRHNREAKNIKQWSKKDSRIGMDKDGNIFEKTIRGKGKQNISYRYFFVSE